MSFCKAGSNLHAEKVFLSRLHIQFDSRLLVVGVEVMFPRIEFYREIAAIFRTRQFGFVAVDGRRQRAPHKLLIAINVNRSLGRLGVGCFL